MKLKGGFLQFWGGSESDIITPFADELVQHLFKFKFMSSGHALLSKTGFDLFKRYFLYINKKAGKIKQVEHLEPDKETLFYSVSNDIRFHLHYRFLTW